MAARYKPAEILFIAWGDSAHQLKIGEPDYIEGDTTPPDPFADGWTETAGPTQGFVDKDENVYVSSYLFSQFKGFNKDGELLFNYSAEESEFWDGEFSGGVVSKFYVDSLGQIYVKFFPPYSYIPVVDRSDKLIARLFPLGETSELKVANFWPNSNDVLTVFMSSYERKINMTYKDDQFFLGGSPSWRARDGYYYYCRYVDSTSLHFYKYSDPDTNGIPPSLDTTTVPLETPVFGSSFLGVDDDLYLYVLVGWGTPERPSILIYNMQYEQVNQIIPPEYNNKYLVRMGYCVRPDGNVYEFRCLDDGLHVIKWSKE